VAAVPITGSCNGSATCRLRCTAATSCELPAGSVDIRAESTTSVRASRRPEQLPNATSVECSAPKTTRPCAYPIIRTASAIRTSVRIRSPTSSTGSADDNTATDVDNSTCDFVHCFESLVASSSSAGSSGDYEHYGISKCARSNAHEESASGRQIPNDRTRTAEPGESDAIRNCHNS